MLQSVQRARHALAMAPALVRCLILFLFSAAFWKLSCPHVGSSYCVCQAGWLGSDCSVGGPGNATASWFTSQSGSKLLEFWVRVCVALATFVALISNSCVRPRTQVDPSVNYLHVRISFALGGYFGIIFNPTSDGMSGGDCWILSASGSTGVPCRTTSSCHSALPQFSEYDNEHPGCTRPLVKKHQHANIRHNSVARIHIGLCQ